MTQRILKRNPISQPDLAIGQGTETQIRGDKTLVVQKIELAFIFRTLDEIRALDWSKYTRVLLHTDDVPLQEYIFDDVNSSADNGDTILTPTPTIAVGRWVKQQYSFTTAQLADVSHVVNTSVMKHAGRMVWNSTTGRPVWADGSADADPWVDASGSTLHTPV